MVITLEFVGWGLVECVAGFVDSVKMSVGPSWPFVVQGQVLIIHTSTPRMTRIGGIKEVDRLRNVDPWVFLLRTRYALNWKRKKKRSVTW